MGSLQKILEKYHMEKWFQRDNLIILVLAGILLVVIALPTESEGKEDTPQVQAEDSAVVSEGETEKTLGGTYGDLYEYTVYLENKLESTLSEMSGVGEVRVMITLEASEEQVVEKDESFIRDNTIENDSEGGTRNAYQTDSKEETVYIKSGTEESPYVTKMLLPKISGVLVVAQGAGTGNVSKNITEIAEALFDIDAHKIKVVAMD